MSFAAIMRVPRFPLGRSSRSAAIFMLPILVFFSSTTLSHAACDIHIDQAAASAISAGLAKGDIAISAAASGCSGPGSYKDGGNGDVFIEAPISVTSANRLTISASRSIVVSRNLAFYKTVVSLNYGGGSKEGVLDIVAPATMSVPGGALSINGSKYALINNVSQLQNMKSTGSYALNSELTFSTSSRFIPIGWNYKDNNVLPQGFVGTLEGLGHSINNLTVEMDNTKNIGLISQAGAYGDSSVAEIRNIRVSNSKIISKVNNYSGGENIGTIVGRCVRCSLFNINVSGSVSASKWAEFVGGIVGYFDLSSSSRSYDIERLSFSGNIDINGEAAKSVGGIIGYCYNSSGKIKALRFNGKIYSTNAEAYIEYIGGVIGRNECNASDSTAVVTIYIAGDADWVVGGFAGRSGSVSNISVVSSIRVDGGAYSVGGVIGESSYYTNIISKSQAKTSIYVKKNGRYVGGFVGSVSEGTISSSRATGTITVGPESERVGGLVGGGGATVTNSHAAVAIRSGKRSSYLGSLVGKDADISGSMAGGSILADVENSYVGGLIGNCNGSRCNVINSAALSKITVGSGADKVGGIAGELNGSIVYSYSATKIVAPASKNVGGLAGYNATGQAQFSYWDKTASGVSTSPIGAGRTSPQMYTQSNYAGWDFTKVWYPPSNGVYPRLRWGALPLTWRGGSSSAKYGTLPKIAPTALTGVLPSDSGKVVPVVTVYNSAGSAVQLSNKMPVGLYAVRGTGLTGAAASKYILLEIGNTDGVLKIVK